MGKKKRRFSGENKADYMRSWKDNVDRKLIEWTEFSFQDIFKSNRSIYSFASESFWRSILWMLRLNFTLGIWRISLDRLFQTLTPFLEKDMFSCLLQGTRLNQVYVVTNQELIYTVIYRINNFKVFMSSVYFSRGSSF